MISMRPRAFLEDARIKKGRVSGLLDRHASPDARLAGASGRARLESRRLLDDYRPDEKRAGESRRGAGRARRG
jgi:hypothetical protein